MSLLRVGFQTAVAGLFSTFYVMLPFVLLVMLPEMRASWSGAHPGASLPLPTRPLVRLNLVWFTLAAGLGVALAAYIAPKGQGRAYTRVSLLVLSVFYALLILEVLIWPLFLPMGPGRSLTHAAMLPPPELAVAIAAFLLAADMGRRLGMAAQNRPGARLTRLLEWCRTMPIGHVSGRPIRLKL